MSNDRQKFIKITIDTESDAYAILELISMKNRFRKSEAISIAITSLYNVLKGKDTADSFFNEDAISLLDEGKSPAKVLSILANNDNEKQSVLREKILKSKIERNDNLNDSGIVKTEDNHTLKENTLGENTNGFGNNIHQNVDPDTVEELSFFQREQRGIDIQENQDPVEELSFFQREQRGL